MAVSSLVRIVAVFGVVTAIAAKADEGMWTFNNFPSAKVAKTYGFAPDQAWLDNVRLSSVRLARGCSGSIVSASGLVMTNNHCARSCIQQLSTAADDRVQHGFYASRAEDEVKCPDIEINQLVEIGDVTKRIQDKLAGLEGAQFAAAYKVEAAAIAEECSAARPAIRCDVVDLYRGGLYQLYKYRRYQDVRLVFAPELAIAFFGGDPDNFEFPRYDLDVSYLRIYDNGKPLAADHYLRYAAADLKDGELTFVSGNPGATSRLDTVAQLGFARDVVLPANLYLLAEQRGVLEQFSAETPEHARIANNDLLRVENSYKGIKGRFAALVDPAVFQAKRADEDALRAKVAADPELARSVGPAWDNIARAVDRLRLIEDRFTWLEARAGFGSTLLTDARALVREAAESAKPEGQRLREYTEANFPILRQSILSPAPIYKELETLQLGFGLTKLREVLGPDDAAVKAILGKDSPHALAARLIDGTSLADPAVRRSLLDGGRKAIDASTDPLIVFAKSYDGLARAVRKDSEDNVDAVIRQNAALISKARFALFGTSVYPDATFTPRLSYGAVRSFPAHGVEVPPFTTIAGLYERATGSDPFKLPQSWLDARAALDPAQKMNVATTNDIIGGNSGSPMINRRGEVVGLVFDGNIDSLGGEYAFDARVNRTVAVTVGALRMALDKVYHADRLVEELKPAF
jgi:hypothetical protein